MTNTTTISRTEAVLASMLTENTGAHFLDSGGAYGRSWERNQSAVARSGLTAAEHFMSRDEAWVDRWDCVTIDVFHYLRQRLDYSPTLDHAWQLWVRMDDTERWEDDHKYTNSSWTFQRFIKAMIDKGWAAQCEWSGGYTYNEENLLSQDFVYEWFETTDECPWSDFPETFVGISIHNGCDARGGFTDFHVFQSDPYCMYDYGDASMYYQCDGSHDHDQNQLTLDGSRPFHCEHVEYGIARDIRGGYVEWYDTAHHDNIDPLEEVEADDDYDGPTRYRCTCGGLLTLTSVNAPYPSC